MYFGICIEMIDKRSRTSSVTPTFPPQRSYESDKNLTNLNNTGGFRLEGGVGFGTREL